MLLIRSQSLVTITIVLSFVQAQIGQIVAQQAVNESKHHSNINSHQKCAKQSIILARQMLTYELDMMNDYLPVWFNDLDKDELIEEQKQSLSNIVMSGEGRKLLNSGGQPLFEIESSYFRPITSLLPQGNGLFSDKKFASEQRSLIANSFGASSSARNASLAPNSFSKSANVNNRHINLKILRRHQDKCILNIEKQYYSYAFALSIGPFEHHLDVVYNLPHDLLISQPISWRYAQVITVVPRMSYEIILKQSIDLSEHLNKHNDSFKAATLEQQSIDKRTLNSNFRETLPVTCPSIEIKEVTYISQQADKLSITSQGLSLNNQTRLQIKRLFDDYTRPTVSQRLKQMLKFYLSNKTLPLSPS